MALKTPLGALLLEAYKEALKTRKPNDFTVTGIASTIIRLEGRDGRIAVQATKREISPNSAVLGSPRQNQGAGPKKSVRLTFPKQEEETGEAASETATKFGLKRVGATQDNDQNLFSPEHPDYQSQGQKVRAGEGAAVDIEELIAERDYYKATAENMAKKLEAAEPEEQPDEPSQEDQGLFEDLQEALDKEPEQAAGNPNLPKMKDPPPPPAKAQGALPLSEAEQGLVKTMKPGGVGREFGLDRLRATLTEIGIDWSEEHSATVLAGALLKHLNPK